MHDNHVTVVGAGPLGAATAYWLARYGCGVAVYDAGAAGSEGASRHSGGMLRCIDPDPVVDVLSALGTGLLNRWDELKLPGSSPVDAMPLWWLADEELAQVLRSRLRAQGADRAVTILRTGDAAAIEPALGRVRAPWIVHDPAAGVCDVRLLVRSLLWGARKLGAHVHEHCPIHVGRNGSGQIDCVAQVGGLSLAGDVQVLAMGQGLPHWLPGAGGVTRRSVPQVQVTGMPPLPGAIIDARSATYVRPLAGGNAFIGWSGMPLQPGQSPMPALHEAQARIRELAATFGWQHLPRVLSLIPGTDAYTDDCRPLLRWSQGGRTCCVGALSGRGLKYALLLGACVADGVCHRLGLAGPGRDLPEVQIALDALHAATPAPADAH